MLLLLLLLQSKRDNAMIGPVVRSLGSGSLVVGSTDYTDELHDWHVGNAGYRDLRYHRGGNVLVELKALDRLTKRESAQIVHYLAFW